MRWLNESEDRWMNDKALARRREAESCEGFVFYKVEQVILLRGETVLLCWANGATSEASGEPAKRIFEAATASGLFVAGVNGRRLVRPYRWDLLKREVA